MKPESKIFVAGHRGLLGSAVSRSLTAQGHTNQLLRTRAELDLLDQKAVAAFFAKEKPEYVFLCAAKVGGIRANMLAPGDFLYQNLQIQCNVIESAYRNGVKKLLFVGSSCIYPKEPKIPITEDQLMTGPLEASNEGYAIAKIAGLKTCEMYRKQYGVDYISGMPTNLYGMHDNYDLESSHLMPALIRKMHTAKVKKQPFVEIWGSGKPRREFMLSDDCADALVFLMKNYSGDQHVNVGTGVDHEILELARIVAKVVGVTPELKLDPSKPDGTFRKVLDVSKLTKMGWRPKRSLEDGIAIAYKEFLERVESGKIKL